MEAFSKLRVVFSFERRSQDTADGRIGPNQGMKD
jgi:hypothetical protein